MCTQTAYPFSTHLIPQADIHVGDYLFLCTDGVREQITDDMLVEMLNPKLPIQTISENIITQCLGKTRDNFTFQLIQR
jgi:protein phosphatase